MVNEQDRSLQCWMNSLNSGSLNLWRESMANLRQLHNDVWNGVRFFTTVNGILLAAMAATFKLGQGSIFPSSFALMIAVLGTGVTLIAREILHRHRRHYLDMLLRKTLIEHALGFYEVDLSFPWSVPANDLPKLRENPKEWIQDRMNHEETITHRLFRVYDCTIAVWLLAIIACMANLWFYGWWWLILSWAR
jgi:hypothetical protein